MTEERERKATKALLAVAKMAGKELDDFALSIYIESLVSMNEEQFEKAIALLKQSFKESKLPTIAEIEKFASGTLHGDELAIEIAESITSAIPRFGRYNATGARESLGEAAWAVIEKCGGWQHLCDIPDYRTLSVEKARLRDMAKVVQKRALGGMLDAKPQLPSPLVSQKAITGGS